MIRCKEPGRKKVFDSSVGELVDWVYETIVCSCTKLPLSNTIHDIQDSNVVPHDDSSFGILIITNEKLGKVISHPTAENRNSSLSRMELGFYTDLFY